MTTYTTSCSRKGFYLTRAGEWRCKFRNWIGHEKEQT
jgi:hypothetical protein